MYELRQDVNNGPILRQKKPQTFQMQLKKNKKSMYCVGKLFLTNSCLSITGFLNQAEEVLWNCGS